MPIPSDIGSNQMLRDYAQGVAAEADLAVANFLAPEVPVPTLTGRYKIYSNTNRFKIPDARRALGGPATTVQFGASDGTYTCQPHALDFPIDKLELLDDDGVINVFKEGANMIADLAALYHENDVITKALAALGAGTAFAIVNGASANDPIALLDAHIQTVIKSARTAGSTGIRILFGAGAWLQMKSATGVRSRFITGTSGKQFGIVTQENARQLFLGEPEIMVTYAIKDSAKEGLAASIDWLLDNNIIIFASRPTPNRIDPSFMKTFRPMGAWMVPGSYETADGRNQVAKYDWTEEVAVTNVSAAIRLNVTSS